MFFFVPCQVGVERVLKDEMRALFGFNSAFSRPGFVTFKVPDDNLSQEDCDDVISQVMVQSVFARTASISLGKVDAKIVDQTTSADFVKSVWQLVDSSKYFINRIHVFKRDRFMPGQNGFEPSITSDLVELHRELIAGAPHPKFFGMNSNQLEHPAFLSETVLDVVEVDESLYFVGVHFLADGLPIHAYYPGGIMPIRLPDNAVSRAWLKFEEGLRWAGFTIADRSCCVDIGAAPGGGSQVLLSRGAQVIGVDPAEIDPIVLNNPRFKHIRGRMNQTKHSLYKDAQWIIADINNAPKYTLDVLDDVTLKNPKIKGMLFTLKLPQWSLVPHIPEYIKRIRGWGFNEIQAKQLTFNRREITIAAQKIDTPKKQTAKHSTKNNQQE
ncbi:MAG: hypothetical protein LBQ66_09600 [Planctomycetaceae bacterium]|jgi:23S rRNA (cytidine2498-2'-O)-methyltransferase|nr:hypothetical protein [Planctomycetaceae bacterium]